MSVQEKKVAEQNSALLTFLAGSWTTRFTAYVHSDLGLTNGVRMYGRLAGVKVRGLFQPLSDGGLAGRYTPIEQPTGDDESSGDCFLRLELDRSDNSLVAYLGSDKSVPGIKGVWSNSGLRFRGDFHNGMTMWEVFLGTKPEITAWPSTVSVILCQETESSWLLDVAFTVEQPYPSQTRPVGLRCQLDLWHFRERPSVSTPLHPQDIEDSFDKLLKTCDEVKQDAVFTISEIDDLIASLEDSKAKCEEQVRLLEEVKSNAESGKDDAASLDGDLHEAILQLHEDPRVPAEGSAVADEVKDILTRTWAEVEGLQADAESLEAQINSIEPDVELPDDLISSVWTNAGYARGQRLLRENRHQLPQPDLNFLGPLQPSVSKLSRDATRIVKTTAVLVQVALRGEPSEELDYAPQIASMAKTCERIVDDMFKEKREPIERDPVVAALVSDEHSWQYRIPARLSKVTCGDLTNVVKMVKKSIETNKPIRWNGMGNKRVALLLFGGWIPVYQATCEHVLNPLGVNDSGEYVQTLPDRLSEFQDLRNGFVHHDLANTDDLLRTWQCFQDCLMGLLQACYAASD